MSNMKTEQIIVEALNEEGGEGVGTAEGQAALPRKSSAHPVTTEPGSIEISESMSAELPVPKEHRFVTYKVKQLDWYEVETRVKQICNGLLKPVAETAGNAKSMLEH